MLTVMDEHGLPTAVRVELLGGDDKPHIPPQAVPIANSCSTDERPQESSRDALDNLMTGTRQFYLDSKGLRMELRPGTYRIRVYKGLEYRPHEMQVLVGDGELSTYEVQLERWVNMPGRGWYSSDDHIHLPRMTATDNKHIAAMMAAENLHVANILQMGSERLFDISEQMAFGDAGAYREDNVLLLSGQEHPRTHILGHAIVLGADRANDERGAYLDYNRSWVQAKAARGLIGYAHWAIWPAWNGISIDAPTGMISFIESLQLDYANYDALYAMLDLGMPAAPTAGSDFPCLPSIPGRSRFYTRVEGELNRLNWLAGLDSGRTFVTNGPILSFTIDGQDIGDTVTTSSHERLRIEAGVRFDSTRDDVDRLLLIRNGEIIASWDRVDLDWNSKIGEIRAQLTLPAGDNAWYVLRARGAKVDETPNLPIAAWLSGANLLDGEATQSDSRQPGVRPSEAHTAPIYVRTGSESPTAIQRKRDVARLYLERLQQLRDTITDPTLENFSARRKLTRLSDAVSDELLLDNLSVLLQAIDSASAFYQGILAGSDDLRP